ncbi:bifunctional diguanylate cyclase/phosphodiesterase [Ruminococcaceae bacterium OttesenSCG-928-N02]|nr:bifunctional diguanylate cyclase/phosphodiesterase [Ruminococcaceae bacterium OttesenSCG-928-N02]
MDTSKIIPIDTNACVGALSALQQDVKALKKTAVLKLHLENFNLFNSTFGYQYGDMLLEAIVKFLQASGGTLFRTSGVDFVLIMPGKGYLEGQQIADDISERFARTWHIGEIDTMATCSMGLLLPSLAAEPALQMLEKLDYAIQYANEQGQNFVCIYDETVAKKKHFEHVVAESLQWNLANNWDNLEVRCRITMNVETGTYTRAECYARLFTEEYGFSGAERFMPVADKTGTVYPLDIQIVNVTCKLIRKLMDEGRHFENIAVPVTAVLFLQENVDQIFTSILKHYGVPAEKLALEVSESAMITAYSSVNIMMQQLADMGIEIILTNFGTGYSGINNVINLPVSAVKLDRMLIWELETNPRSAVIIQGLVDIAKKLGLKVIAEGVETENQKQMLDQFGCPYQQGFYYSATVPMNEVGNFLPTE